MQSTDLWTRGRSRGAKTSKEREESDFWCFRGVEMRVVDQNSQYRPEIIELRAGPTPIDPCGHDGVKSLEICSYLAVEL